MEFQLLGKEILRKDYCNILASKSVKGDSFDGKNIVGLRVPNNKEVSGILGFREVRD